MPHSFRQPSVAGNPVNVDIKIEVADQVARFALSVEDVQNGDFVFQTDPGLLYEVIDAGNLDSAAGYLLHVTDLATQEVMEVGTSEIPVIMTPLRIRQAIDARLAEGIDIDGGQL